MASRDHLLDAHDVAESEALRWIHLASSQQGPRASIPSSLFLLAGCIWASPCSVQNNWTSQDGECSGPMRSGEPTSTSEESDVGGGRVFTGSSSSGSGTLLIGRGASIKSPWITICCAVSAGGQTRGGCWRQVKPPTKSLFLRQRARNAIVRAAVRAGRRGAMRGDAGRVPRSGPHQLRLGEEPASASLHLPPLPQKLQYKYGPNCRSTASRLANQGKSIDWSQRASGRGSEAAAWPHRQGLTAGCFAKNKRR